MKQHHLSCVLAITALICSTYSKTFSQTDWHITGNSGTSAANNFVGTTDNKPLSFRTNNAVRMRISQAGNIGIGTNAPVQKLDVDGNINLGKGSSLFTEGLRALRVDPLTANIFLGISAGAFNTTGTFNTATGSQALLANQTGSNNTAYGANALLQSNASDNVAYGTAALFANLTGTQNTAIGTSALGRSNSSFNTAVGHFALGNTTESFFNTAVGFLAGALHNNGWNNVFVGANADVNGEDFFNAVAIGESALCTGVNQVRLGNSVTNSIGGFASFTNISDVRVKKNIKENVPGLAFINKLKPITYNLDLDAADKIIQPPAKKDKDGKLVIPSQLEINARIAKQQILYTGFAAQDVEKAAKELNYDFSGVDAAKNSKDLYGLRYSDFVVPLVKAVQELSQKVEKLEAALAEKNSSDLSSASSKNVTITDASLGQNAPNPFTHGTSINYTVPQKFSSAQIIIYDNNGRTIKQVNISAAGKGTINVDASILSAGKYSYSLIVDGNPISSKQMILTK